MGPDVSRTVTAALRDLAEGPAWRPPPLLPLPHAEHFASGDLSWTGQPDRFEAVKSLRRSANARGFLLTDAELASAVAAYEAAMESMLAHQFEQAARAFVELACDVPSFTLAYYRAGVCVLAAAAEDEERKRNRGRPLQRRPDGAGLGLDTDSSDDNDDDDDDDNDGGGGGDDGGGKGAPEEEEEAKQSRAGSASCAEGAKGKQAEEHDEHDEHDEDAATTRASLYFGCAAFLEPSNTALVFNMDLFLRARLGVPIPDQYFEETGDPASARAFADLKALTPIILNAAARHHPKSGQ